MQFEVDRRSDQVVRAESIRIPDFRITRILALLSRDATKCEQSYKATTGPNEAPSTFKKWYTTHVRSTYIDIVIVCSIWFARGRTI
jgi:hypothetical protein